MVTGSKPRGRVSVALLEPLYRARLPPLPQGPGITFSAAAAVTMGTGSFPPPPRRRLAGGLLMSNLGTMTEGGSVLIQRTGRGAGEPSTKATSKMARDWLPRGAVHGPRTATKDQRPGPHLRFWIFGEFAAPAPVLRDACAVRGSLRTELTGVALGLGWERDGRVRPGARGGWRWPLRAENQSTRT